jgi:hypothetical protein
LERLPKEEKFNTVNVVTPDRDAQGNAVEVPVTRGQVSPPLPASGHQAAGRR